MQANEKSHDELANYLRLPKSHDELANYLSKAFS